MSLATFSRDHELLVSISALPVDPVQVELAPYRQLRIHGRSYSLVPPSIRDPRIHLAAVIISIFVLGITWLGFQVSIAQILVTVLTCAVIEVSVTARRTQMLAWPASAMQTATSTALLLRVVGTENGDYWTLRGWYFFAGVAAFGLLTKYTVRFRSGHVFNPSNIALILAFIILGSDRVEPLDFWWAPLGWAMVAAYAVIFIGGVYICSRLRLIGMGIAFWSSLAVGIGVLAALNHSITVRWSLIPIEGSHFWWIILTSPEIFIFLYFMITDPRTVPSGRVARIVFGVSVGVLASLFMAPWKTEYGAKVGLLSSLAVMCACRKLLERRLPVVGSPEDDPRQFFTKLLTSGRTDVGAKNVAVRVDGGAGRSRGVRRRGGRRQHPVESRGRCCATDTRVRSGSRNRSGLSAVRDHRSRGRGNQRQARHPGRSAGSRGQPRLQPPGRERSRHQGRRDVAGRGRSRRSPQEDASTDRARRRRSSSRVRATGSIRST